MLKRVIFLSFLLITVTGCTNRIGGDIFFNQIDELQYSLNHSEWEQFTNEANELKRLYEEDKWVLQLLGDEGEYEALHENINQLIAATKEKDRTQTRVSLASIRTLLQNIYTM
ncbi:DUF4363 family protein [Tuberibacillus sp. Marseille-P3662]|uniref:DUF4363 family protein n=1 Tax=Tuberibacillus sp. Marseille-P3662 TaxID=1965358 RepID=UPI000A1CE15F|nr:DUF4363 family protein [Tuberibacillus sp. Marseille-P3662]